MSATIELIKNIVKARTDKARATKMRRAILAVDQLFSTIAAQNIALEQRNNKITALVEDVRHQFDRANKAESGPIPLLLWCPACGDRHVDEGEFATKSHHTHACQNCGLAWRPAVGVRFLPGFKDETK